MRTQEVMATSKDKDAVPFDTAEEAWFWYVSAQEARASGARFTAGQALCPRPCEPMDIILVIDRLYRQRRLQRDHLLVLRHYGMRHAAPEPSRKKEIKAHILWHEAMDRIQPILVRKNIVRANKEHIEQSWARQAQSYAAGLCA